MRAIDKMTKQVFKAFRFGRSYVKMSGESIEQVLLASSGIEFAKKEIESYIECAFCGAKNSPSALYCERLECGRPLIIGDAQKELKGLMKQLRGDRKVLIKQIINDSDFECEILQDIKKKRLEDLFK